jgi:hypothetical protein
MSGVEVAGLVLGALPLVIAALEEYKRGLKPLRRLFGAKLELESLMRRLRNERFLFRTNLRIIIRSARPGSRENDVPELLTSVFEGGAARQDVQQYLQDNEALDMFDGILFEHERLLNDAINHLEHIRRLHPVINPNVNTIIKSTGTLTLT